MGNFLEVWALEGFGVAHILQEMLTYKFDHIRVLEYATKYLVLQLLEKQYLTRKMLQNLFDCSFENSTLSKELDKIAP